MIKRAPLIVWVIVVVLGGAWWFFGMSPLMHARTEYIDETTQLTTKEASLQEELTKLRGYQENEVDTQAKLIRLARYIPEGLNQQAIFNSYQTLMDAAGVTIENVSFSTATPIPEAPPSPYEGKVLAKSEVQLTVSGGYFQLIDFLRRLETKMGRANLVNSINLSPAEQTGGAMQMSLTMMSTVFLYMPNPEPKTEATETPSDEGSEAPKETTNE